MNVETQCKHELLKESSSQEISPTSPSEVKQYKVHRAVAYCQSDVFSRMCLSPFKEEQSQTIELLGMTQMLWTA